jgi:23S rRNA (uracil1939-C5)-methyltransferase
MKKNDLTELFIEDLSAEGFGIGHAQGMAVFVKDALPGDRILARIVKEKKTYAYARLEKLISQGPDRVCARCPVARRCGGCQIQELSYPVQLALKERKVRDNLIRIGGFRFGKETGSSVSGSPALDSVLVHDSKTRPEENGFELEEGVLCPILGMDDPWHYRNKAQFPIGESKDGMIIAGFYAGRTHVIIDHHQCLIGIEENQQILECVISWMQECGVSPYREETGKGTIRHVMTRAGFSTGELMVVIVAASSELKEEKRLVEKLLALPSGSGFRYQIRSIVLNVNRERTNVILGRESRVLYGKDFIEDRIGSLAYRISSRSFYQVNPVQTAVLYQTALEYAGLTGTETVWDLYCGTGTISLFLAQKAGRVYGVEVIPEAVENARQNAAINQIDNCEFIAGKAEELAPELPPADVIVVDPPRKGLDRTVTETILRAGPDRIVYVSCDSATLARDLALFVQGGYRVQKVQPVDQFCHTVHVETVCLLTHKG